MSQQTPEPQDVDISPPRSIQRWIKRVLAGLATIVCVVLGYFLFKNYATRSSAQQASRLMQTQGLPVSTATARKGHIGVYLDAIGTVTPVYTASITSQVNGLITAVHYTEGQIVHKGDPLIDIDPRPFEAQVLQAQGTLDRDINVLAQAKMDLDRYREAWARRAIPKQQLDDQEKIVLQNEGQVKSDQGNLQFLQVQLGWAHITSPFTGRVGLRLVDPGNVVVLTAGNQGNTANATTSLVVITQIEPITIVFTLAQDSLSEVRTAMRRGRPLPVYAYDRTMQTKIATGALTSIDNQIDTTTGTVKLRATFENSDDALFPNQFVNARLLVKTLKGITLIPSQAIQHNGQTAFVYVIEDAVAHIQNVKPGVSDSKMTLVEGIRPGAVVATDNFEKLQNGLPVTSTTRPAPGPAANPRKP